MKQQELKELLTTFIEERNITCANTINSAMGFSLVSCDVDPMSIVLHFPVMEWQLNPMHQMHGGMICTVLDMAMGAMAFSMSGGLRTPTIDMSVSFVRGVSLGEELLVKVVLDVAGKRIVKMRSEAVMKNSGKTAASAIGTYIVNS